MKIELKNIKYSEFASQETYCYEASLYIDGKRVAVVGNDGHGGCDYSYRTGAEQSHSQKCTAIDAAEQWLREHGEVTTFGEHEIREDLESRCHHLVSEWLRDKEVKKLLRRITYIKGRGIYQLAAKYKPTPANLAGVQKSAWWDDTCELISGLDVERAKERLTAAGFYGGAE